jgi:hypothetical protein
MTIEQFEDTKVVIKSRNTKKDKQCNGQKKKRKQMGTKHYIETFRLNNTKPIKNGVNSSASEWLSVPPLLTRTTCEIEI